MAKGKGTIGQTTIYKTLHRNLKIEEEEPKATKNQGEGGCFEKESRSCFL
jgi:hypothetical protein